MENNESEFEFLLQDRLGVIRQTINKYGEDKFHISFSGGKDSTVLSYLIDLALPNNKIPRVYANTGIEYFDIVNFVKEMQKRDPRIVIINPEKPIRETLDEFGYPFKSKTHSFVLQCYQKLGMSLGVKNYINPPNKKTMYRCPKKLLYQFTPEFKLKCSRKCCYKLKKDPLHKYEKETGRKVNITGMLAEEGGSRRRLKNNCIITNHKTGELLQFHPMAKCSKKWEDWFIQKYNIKLCKLYYEPYNFERTGCKGCPFALHLQKELDTMEKLLPNERKQCEFIWKPVYDEYRRIGYRLRKE